MIIADRLRDFREMKRLSQGELEKRTGLLRCYLSRVENGHTVPTLETLEKMARAFEIPLYHFFYEDEKPADEPAVIAKGRTRETEWGSRGKAAYFLRKLRTCLGKMDERDRQLLLQLAARINRRREKSHYKVDVPSQLSSSRT